MPHKQQGDPTASRFEYAADCLMTAMTSEPGSARESRYLTAARIFTEAAQATAREQAPTDCGLCTHPAHDDSGCSAVNEFGQCCCWWYTPASEYDARNDAA